MMVAADDQGGSSMGLLDGHRAVVTGGASGIGRATCRAMAREGATVAVLDIDGVGAQSTADEFGGQAFTVDVTDAAAMDTAIRAAAGSMGGLTALFNNAGASNLMPIDRWDPDEWDRIVRLNLSGVFHGMRVCAPLIVESGGWRGVSTAAST